MDLLTDKNKVLFLSDVRENLGGNLKVMYDYIGDEYNKIVSLKGDRRVQRSFKEKVKLIYHLSTSKYILLENDLPDIFNEKLPVIIQKIKEINNNFF